MKKFGVFNKKGVIENVILLSEEAGYSLPEGLTLIEDDDAEIGHKVVEGKVIVPEPEPEPEPEPTYQQLRRTEYPPEGDQLDVIWKQFEQMRTDGTVLLPETDAMLTKIKTVKSRNPKK